MMLCNIMACGNTSSDSVSDEVKIITEKGAAGLNKNSAANSTNQSSGIVFNNTNNGSSEEKVYDPDIGAWYPYWDYDTADEEMEIIGDDLNTLCFFAAYYDVNSKPFIPEDTRKTKDALIRSGALEGKKTYLTFVNDKLLEKGSSLKDTELLYELFSDSSNASQHAEEILKMCKNFGCDGIEIDYEAIKKDYTLWGYFNHFIVILSEKAKAEEMPLRVVFEPSAPLDAYQWPEYPEYVMMCYNLYGYGTEPGPKADIEWLKELSERMKGLPGNINMALATGGFDFSSNGSVSQIDYADAVSLLAKYRSNSNRDISSAAINFTYTDEAGITHEVWYADQDTINAWIDTVKNCGIPRVSIWRLGGNIA